MSGLRGAYYNEIDPAAAHILRAMIASDVIAPGEVDFIEARQARLPAQASLFSAAA